jgi:hypothetical protein
MSIGYRYIVRRKSHAPRELRAEVLAIAVIGCLTFLSACDPDADSVCVPDWLKAPVVTEVPPLPHRDASSDRKRDYHIVLDRSTGMAGFIRVSARDSRAGGNLSRTAGSEFSEVLGDLPSLINEQEDLATLSFWSLNHASRPEAAPDRLEEGGFRAALRECRTTNSKQSCPPYTGYGLVAPVFEHLLLSGTNWLQATPTDVVILVTDLQPDDQDAPGDGGKIGKALRDIVERGDRAVGLVGVPSRFWGPVNDLPGGQTSDPLDGTQPFFLIIIGPPPVVSRLERQLIASLPSSPSGTEGNSTWYHAVIFTRRDPQMMAKGHWVGTLEDEVKKQTVLPEATALDADSGRQFVVPSRAAKPGGTLVDFRYELSDDNTDPRLKRAGVSVVAAPNARPTAQVWAPRTSHSSDCSGWTQLDGSAIAAKSVEETGHVKLVIDQNAGRGLAPGFLYLVDFRTSVQGSAGAQSFPWVKFWTVKGDWHDAWREFQAGKRDVLGVANLDTMLQILSIAEHQTGLDRPNDRIPFVFRVED